MRSKIFVGLCLLGFFFFGCKEETIVEIPTATSTIFIDFEGVEFDSITKEDSPILDLIVRSGTELRVENRTEQKGFDLLNIHSESEFTKTINSNGRNGIYLKSQHDSLDIFSRAAKIFSDEKPSLLYLNVNIDSIEVSTIVEVDSLVTVLIDKINYSVSFNKTILVFMFNKEAGSKDLKSLHVLINGPKIRNGAELTELVSSKNLQTSILDCMGITLPENWRGEKVKHLHSKNIEQ